MSIKAKIVAVAAASFIMAGCAHMHGSSNGGATAKENNCKGMGGCRGVYNGCNGFNNCLGKPKAVSAKKHHCGAKMVKSDYKGMNSCKGEKK